MSTLTTYRTSVQLLGYDAIATATIDAAVQAARRRVLGDRRWSYLETTAATIPTVADVATISLAGITDLANIDAVRMNDSAGKLPMAWRPRQIIRDLQDNYAATGVPEFWTRVKNTVVFYPTPSKVLTITVEYIPAAADLAASPAVCVIPDRHQDLVIWAAVVPLAFRQRGLAESSAADQYYSKVLLPRHAGQDAVEQRQTSEQIRTGWWGD